MLRLNHVRRDQPWLILLLAIFLLLGGLYSVVTPIFEAGDEVWHYPFVQFLATTGQLPVQDPAHKGLWEQEGGQPPLYYALAAAATFWIDTRDLTQRLWRNPYARIGIPLAYGNKNLVVHTSAENFPWTNTTLAVHLIRFLSLLFSAVTVVTTYLIACEIFSFTRVASASNTHTHSLTNTLPYPHTSLLSLLAAALVAFNPMFLFISASVNNDSLGIALASLGLWLNVQLITRGATTRRLVALGLTVAFAALTKESDLALIPLSLLVISWLAWRTRDLRLFIHGAAWVVIPTVLIAGWWYARNYFLYGDPLALNVWLQISGGRAPVSLLGLLDEFQGFRISFWGNFGGVNLIAPEWVYSILDAFTLLAAVGLIFGLVRRRLPALLLIPALWLAFEFAALVRWTLSTYASQGRLIFPAISAVAILLVVGLRQFTDALLRFTHYVTGHAGGLLSSHNHPFTQSLILTLSPSLSPLLTLFLAAFVIAAPFAIIEPAYALPPLLNADAHVPHPVHITFVTQSAPLELVGYESGISVKPGAELPVTLYWRAPALVTDDLYVYIHLYDATGRAIGQWDALPGNGMYPARLWQTNEIIVDRYRVPISTDAVAQQLGRLEVGLARIGSTVPLTARSPSGQNILPSIGEFKIALREPNTTTRPPHFDFDHQLELLDLQVTAVRGESQFQISPPRAGALDTPLAGGDMLHVDYTLRAVAAPHDDYTVFVHLLNPEGKIISQRDTPPRGGAYSTSFWDAGEEVADQLALTIPADASPGEYQIEFGLYRADNGARLAVNGTEHESWRALGDHLLLAPIPLAK